ncbi:MAG: TlpA family protein disulfide reductase, partial [Planctomycetes bacterium]|nr:TlpA family protein disulfide reductase [Planctomycetota bacterium]
MTIISNFRKTALFLALVVGIFLSNVSFAKDSIRDITSTELKEIIRTKKDKIVAVT